MQHTDDKQSLEHQSDTHVDHEAQHVGGRPEDEAQKVLAAAQDQAPFTAEEEKALLRKVDIRVIPMLWVTTGLQFADKSR